MFSKLDFAQVMGKHLTDDEINMNLNNCKTSGRWIILQGLHNQLENLYRLKFPKTSEKFMICATIPRGVALPEFILSQFRLQNIDLPETTFERIEALIYLVAEEQKFEEQLKKVCSLSLSLLLFSPGGLQALLGLCHSLPRENP